jgi:hypothetical protein
MTATTSSKDDSSSSSGVGVVAVVDGHFNPNEIEDESNPYPRPLFLVPLPPLAPSSRGAGANNLDTSSSSSLELLAYGGDNGHLYHIHHQHGSSTSPSNSTSTPRAIRKYDDEIRALAISPDGKRIALGFDDGSTKIYAFDAIDDDDNEDGQRHPFLPRSTTQEGEGVDTNDDFNNDGGGFLSQVDDGFNNDSNSSRIVEFDGPRLDASIRQLAFDPRSGGDHYYLAIGSESGHSPLVIVDVANESSVMEASYLEEKSGDEHRGSGVRSVAYSIVPNLSGSSSSNVLLATLGMDGKLVTWDVSSYSTDPSLLWDVVHADMTPVVPKPDVGNMMGSDAGDGACRVVWDVRTMKDDEDEDVAVVYFPGKTDIQYRLVPIAKKNNALTTEEYAQYLKGPPKFIIDGEGGGHGDTIVAMVVAPHGVVKNDGTNRIVTGGRDGKLFLWNVNLHNGEGTATELRLERRAGTVGIPPITSILWQSANELHVAFADGTVSTVPINVDQAASKKKKVAEKRSEHANQPAVDEEAVKESAKQDEFDDSDDDDAMFAEDAQAAKDKETATSGKQRESASRFIDDEAEDGGGDDNENDDNEIQYDDVVKTSNDNENNNDSGGDNVNDFDEGDENMFDTHNDNFDDDAAPTANFSTNHRVTTAGMFPLQPAFAPSSTPFGEPRRILCWNHVGCVSMRPDDSGEDSNNNLIDITFLETAGLVGGRRPITFTDNVGFIVGTLGEEGALFASDILEDDEDDDDFDDDDFGVGVMSEVARKVAKRSQRKSREKGGGTRGSSVYFHRFETFGRNADKDWVIALPDGERVLGCATGSGWGAVITR